MPKPSIQSQGGKACFAKHGRDHFKKIARIYWESPAGQARRQKMRNGKAR